MTSGMSPLTSQLDAAAAERVAAVLHTLKIGQEARPTLARTSEEASARFAQDTIIELIEDALYGR